jgi:hypothetical protein
VKNVFVLCHSCTYTRGIHLAPPNARWTCRAQQ